MTEPSTEAVQFISDAADNIISLDDLVAEHSEEFGNLYVELLNSPERRLDSIEAKYTMYMYLQSIEELGDDSQRGYWQNVSNAMEKTFDEVNSIPTNERGGFFHDVRKTMSAVSWEQAFIESGVADAAVASGIAFGEVMRRFAEVIDPTKDFKPGPGLADVRKQKLTDRKVGTADSPFKGTETEEEPEA